MRHRAGNIKEMFSTFLIPFNKTIVQDIKPNTYILLLLLLQAMFVYGDAHNINIL